MDVEEGEAKMCRLCGQYEKIYIDVFGEEGIKRYLDRKIYRKINILIKEDDNLPQQICKLCNAKLDFACDFYDTCHEIQEKLWATVEKNNPQNDTENKENRILLPSDLRRQVKTSKSLKKKIQSTNADSSIIYESSKNQSHEDRLGSCLRDIYPNTQSDIASWKQKQPVDHQRDKGDDPTQKETASGSEYSTVNIKSEIKEEYLPDSNSASFCLGNSMVWIHSMDWFKCDPAKPKNTMTVNDNPLLGDEAESNRNIDPESNKPAVLGDIGESSTTVLDTSKRIDSLELSTISSQNNESSAFGLSTGGSEERCEQNEVSGLITNEQKKTIETCYTIDTDLINKHAEEVRSNMIMRDKNDIKCNLCSAQYFRRDKCEVHIWTHLDIKPYKCKKCSFMTVTASNIRCHIRKVHLKIKFHCELCSKEYINFTLLKEHINTHTGERPYKCKTCDFSSTNRQTLKKHMDFHTSGEG